MAGHKITFLPDSLQTIVTSGKTIMAAAAEAGVELEGPCGGKGTCGKCRVLRRVGDEEQWVLACQTPVVEDTLVEIPQAQVSVHRKSEITEKPVEFRLNPGLNKKIIKVKEPSLDNQLSDTERVRLSLEEREVSFSLQALKSVPAALREKNGEVTVTLIDREVLAIEPGNTTERLFGLAVDIGTTTVVASLVDLLTGETLSTASATNSQNIFGADVIARIEHVINDSRGLAQLQRRVITVINRLIAKLSEECSIQSDEIFKVTIVGNTTMSHLFLGLNPANLAPAPFIPVVSRSVKVRAYEVGLNVYPAAPIIVFPIISGYVGGDTVGVILATGIYREPGVTLAIDIGTNGEMVLGVNGSLTTCSTAAGPAFEGAQIRHGMRAAAGAIEGLIFNGSVNLQVIENTPPKGICGSGLIDTVSELVRIGVIDATGRMISREEAGHLPFYIQERLGKDEEGNFFILAPQTAKNKEVVITQKDVRKLQLAKGAIRAGIDILLEQENLRYDDIDQILLAGAFGNYINKQSARAIGLLPPIPLEKIKSVGNAAGMGAKLGLVSEDLFEQAELLARSVRHIELSSRQDFQDKFLDALYFSQ